MYKGHVRRGPFGGLFRQGRPRGYIDFPQAGAELPRGPVHVLGWCVFPGTSVARVELSVNGGPPGHARLAMDRGDIPTLTKEQAAPLSGFEHKTDLSDLAPETREVTVEATAHAMDGRELRLEPVRFAIGPPQPAFEDDDGSATTLRARSKRPLRPHTAPAKPLPGRPLRLLAFSHVLTHGGASLYLLELLRRLSRDHGFECEVVALSDGPLRDAFEDAGMPVHLTDGFPVTTLERYEGNVAELVAWGAAGRFDVALVNTLGSFAGGDAVGRLGVPTVWSVHESFTLPMFWHTAYEPGVLHPYARARAEQALAEAAAVVFPAEATRQLFVNGADPERLVTIPYGVELEDMDRAPDRAAARTRLGIEPDVQLVLCLGSIEARKSQAMLATAFAEIAGRHPRAHLALVGATEDGYCADYRAALREFVRRAGLEQRIRIEPVTDDPYSWHAAADVLVCASDIEALPRVIVEAMVFGTPVLSTRVFGVPELIDDGRTGYLCDMRDAASLAAGLDRVLSASAEELAGVTRAAAERARERHDPAASAATMAALLQTSAVPRALPDDALAALEAPDPPREAAHGR
jgi:glycosyltransferase involved in cell wall biosynthesis